MKISSPILYQINTRVWLKRFATGGPLWGGKESGSRQPSQAVTLSAVTNSYWLGLKSQGIDIVWLMGVWRVAESAIAEYCFEDGLKGDYSKALPDWSYEDVIGSPYAIDRYQLNPKLGSPEELLELRMRLNSLGLQLILDFVPNHFSAHSHHLITDSNAFLQGSPEDLVRDPYTFFQLPMGINTKHGTFLNHRGVGEGSQIFAHGRDPYFVPWQDTAQLDYSTDVGQEFMINQLLEVAKSCDGVRCDMAMLVLRDIFPKTWSSHVQLPEMPEGEFWAKAIAAVRERFPDFTFIAESYWDLEPQLLKCGFDYTYDKGLLDALEEGNAGAVRWRLQGGSPLKCGVHFLENHDEPRAVIALGEDRSLAAAIVISTIPGVRFFHDGQFEGQRVRLPVQLGRELAETPNERTTSFYSHLLPIIAEEPFRSGAFRLLMPFSAFPGDSGHERIIAWSRELPDQLVIIVVNYSDTIASARIPWIWHLIKEDHELNSFQNRSDSIEKGTIELIDRLDSARYHYLERALKDEGLYVLLDPFRAHIFEVNWGQ